jgi:cellobiose phosphorylase
MFGVRSILSDHQLWLPYAVSEYIKITGDMAVLEEVVPFLEGPLMSFAYQKEWAGTPSYSNDSGTLFDHCIRAIEKSFSLGVHGLPLIGMSDWNDGLSKVGTNGRGESVWVGWFLLFLIDKFIPYLEKKGDMETVEKYKMYGERLEKSIEKNAWDGRWYRRAFLDSGIALGSRKLREFKLDSIAQSWSVLSGKANPERAERAMKSAFTELFDGSNFRLLAPALETTPLDPGYVKDYPPGVRENGSQYNHATLWAAQALFKQGKADSAKKILDLVNPFVRTSSLEKVSMYRSEPYVVASDIYAEPSYRGRAGWSWYTGSAGIMYKTILEFLCGFNLSGNKLSFNPSLPSSWKSFKMFFKKNETTYEISFEKPEGFDMKVREVFMDDVLVVDNILNLVYDKKVHKVRVILK